MNRNSSPIRGIALLALALPLGACGDDFGTPCDFPASPEIREACGKDVENGTYGTCVNTNSPQCESRTCAIYGGSEGFCSDVCNPQMSGDCPASATCVPQKGTNRADFGFCVPNKIFDAASAL